MGIEYESVVDHPLAEVFAWHTRPGAMTRLVPPWQPMTVVAETESLADGQAVLGLPGGLRWVAQHDRDSFDPPHRFVDVLSSAGPRSLPARVIGWWRHTHEFAEAPGGGTTGARRGRHHGSRCGAAAHVRLPASPAGRRPRRTSRCRRGGRASRWSSPITGAIRAGRVGALGASDDRRAPGDSAGPTAGAGQGRAAVAARRARARSAVGGRRRGPPGRRLDRGTVHRGAQGRDPRQPHRADAQAGAGGGRQRRRPDGRSSAPRRSASTDTTGATRCCARKACAATGSWPTWSPTGRPPPRPAADAGLRVVTVRTGIVQAAAGGTLRLLRPLFLAGLGGRLGSGRQWLSWIGLDDLLDVYYRALYDTRLAGPVNAVGPDAGAQHRIHEGAGGCAAPARDSARAVVRSAAAVGRSGCPRTRRGRPAGGADEADRAGAPVPARDRRRRAGSSARARLMRDPR